jgi:hypothetical protein
VRKSKANERRIHMAGKPAYVVFMDDEGRVIGATDLSGRPLEVHETSLAQNIVGATLQSEVPESESTARAMQGATADYKTARCVWRINPITGRLECV